MHKVIGAVIYATVDGYICSDYLVFLQENLFKHDNKSENAEFNCLYGLVIPEILMNIMSCHVIEYWIVMKNKSSE